MRRIDSCAFADVPTGTSICGRADRIDRYLSYAHYGQRQQELATMRSLGTADPETGLGSACDISAVPVNIHDVLGETAVHACIVDKRCYSMRLKFEHDQEDQLEEFIQVHATIISVP